MARTSSTRPEAHTWGRRAFLGGGGGLTLGLATSGLASGCADPEQAASGVVRLTTGLIVEFTPFFVADERGLFDEHGVDATLQGFIIANDGAQAQLAGEADASTLVELPLLTYVDNGEDLVTVAVVTTARNLKVVAQDGIEMPEDLAGRRVAYPFGTGQDYGCAAYLEQFDIPHEDVRHVNSDNAELVPLMARGDVDAIVAVEPQVSQALDAAEGSTEVSPGPAEAYQTRSHLVLERGWAEDNAQTVQNVMRALLDARDLIADEPEASAEIMASAIDMPSDQVRQLWESNENVWDLYLDQDTLDSLDSVASWLRDQDAIEDEIDAASIVDARYLDEVDESAVSI